MRSTIVRFSMCLALCAIAATGMSQLFAGKPGGGGGNCPSGRFCLCASYYCPVTCQNGCKYSNPCIANCAGATNCVQDGPCEIPLP